MPPRPLAPSPERVAHRGASRECRENTLPAFLLALERGADAVELDVHTTADGVVVVHHDPVAAGLSIAATRWSELSHVDVGAGATMPRLDDVLRAIQGKAGAYVELKGDRVEEGVIDVVRGTGGHVALHSFDHAAVARAARAAPDIPRGVLLDQDVREPVAEMRRAVAATGARDVWPHRRLVDEPFVAAARDLGVRVLVWTVNDTRAARRLGALGVDGICTDDVRMLANLF